MSEYTFSGKVKIGRETQEFDRTIEAESEKHAREKVYSQITSEHNIETSKIELK
jgi:ribosomal protein L20A (L18A)